MGITIEQDVGRGRLYWGAGALPAGAEITGVVHRRNGQVGALVRLSNGTLVQGNAGAIRSLPLRIIREEA